MSFASRTEITVLTGDSLTACQAFDARPRRGLAEVGKMTDRQIRQATSK
jgi:hypothetical protein